MSLDISSILKDWPYEPGQVTARKIRGDDGHEKIQLRLDVGILQMESAGRPDGRRPHGFESLYDYHAHRLEQHIQERGAPDGFDLDERACEELRAESVMYYHRYLAEFVLEDFEAVERDTNRNLRLFDLCRTYAREESDRFVMEQYRPYVIMMNARARARISLRENRPKSGLAAVRQGIASIQSFYHDLGQDKLAAASTEIAVLRGLAKEAEAKIPVDPMRQLRQKLNKAVRQEHYEEAAALRDEIRRLGGEREGEGARDKGPGNGEG